MSHRTPELRSIELHRIVAGRIEADPVVLARPAGELARMHELVVVASRAS